MKKIILTFKETDKGLVAMMMQHEQNNPTEKELMVCKQVMLHIWDGGIPSPIIAQASGRTMEEAKQKADIEGDIWMANRGISEAGPLGSPVPDL